MKAPIFPPPSNNLSATMQGVWWLETREDWTKEGQRRIDPILGSDPIGILSYAKNHFAAQFMKRNRNDGADNQVTYVGQNNTVAIDGYDAYFGTYEVNEENGKVSHTLIGSISPSNIGITVSRDLRVEENKLMIQLETTTTQGELIIRTLTWRRIS